MCGGARQSTTDPIADGAREVGDVGSVPQDLGRPNAEDGKAERKRREVAPTCVPKRAGVARREGVTWCCVSALACWGGSGGSSGSCSSEFSLENEVFKRFLQAGNFEERAPPPVGKFRDFVAAIAGQCCLYHVCAGACSVFWV